MFKLVVLSVLVAVAVAAPKPGYLAAAPIAYSSVVGHVPATVSHQSSSVVHSAAFAAPVVHAAPVVSYAAPAVYAAPAHSYYSTYAAAPLAYAHY